MIDLFFTFAMATTLPGEDLFVAEEKTKVEAHSNGQRPEVKKRRTSKVSEEGNLPSYFSKPVAVENPVSELVMKPAGSVELFRGFRVGESIVAKVHHSILAFPDENAPVVAQVESSQLRGIRFIGHSHLEVNSKRVFLNFNRVVVNGQVFGLSAVGLSASGQPGFTGKYYSREAEYFAGDFVSSFVAGYFDGLVPRKTNMFGQTETDTSVDSAVKKGLASGALSSAERFREKLKKVPEFSELQGPLEISILILDQAKKE